MSDGKQKIIDRLAEIRKASQPFYVLHEELRELQIAAVQRDCGRLGHAFGANPNAFAAITAPGRVCLVCLAAEKDVPETPPISPDDWLRGKPLFHVIDRFGHEWKLYEDGHVSGFPEGAVVINRARPLLDELRGRALRVSAEVRIAQMQARADDATAAAVEALSSIVPGGPTDG